MNFNRSSFHFLFSFPIGTSVCLSVVIKSSSQSVDLSDQTFQRSVGIRNGSKLTAMFRHRWVGPAGAQRKGVHRDVLGLVVGHSRTPGQWTAFRKLRHVHEISIVAMPADSSLIAPCRVSLVETAKHCSAIGRSFRPRFVSLPHNGSF